MLDENGNLARGSGANLRWLRDERIYHAAREVCPTRSQPADRDGARPTRLGLVVAERDLDGLRRVTADEVFLTSTRLLALPGPLGERPRFCNSATGECPGQ